MCPETMTTGGTGWSDLRSMVEEFYGALAARDVAGVERVIDANFADDVTLTRPESLPGGGTLEGADRVKRLMSAVAGAQGGPLDPAQLRIERVLESTGEDADDVGVELSFSWNGTPTTSFEWWVVRDLKVTEIRAYYWDTAMMLGRA
jgi:ketosteroid isomerase-like protein